jgi:hypothetical protein
MTVFAREMPTLETRALLSDLIIVGTVDGEPESIRDYTSDSPQVHSVFHVAVEDVLRGRAPGATVNVRVRGGQVDEVRTEWTVTMRRGERVLLFLARYYAEERDDATFVPYFRGCYPVSADGIVELDGRNLLALHANAAGDGRDTMNVDAVRSFIHAAIQRRDQVNAALPEREPEEPELSESGFNALLHVEPGGARYATLDGGDAPPRSGG